MISFIDEAIKVANRSTNRKHKTGCVLVLDEMIIDKGWSHTGSWDLNGLYSVHAEIHAILRARRKGKLNGATAYIATLATKSGAATNAAPCLSCATALIGYGIERVVYTNGEGLSGMYLPWAIRNESLKVYKRRK